MSAVAGTQDITVLKELGKRLAEAASESIHETKREMWRKLNSLEKTRPLVWINEIPWHELESEVRPVSQDPFLARVETGLRQTLYQWENFPADMVLDNAVYSRPVIHSTGFGVDGNIVKSENTHGADDYVPVIKTIDDVKKIKTPEISADREATRKNHEMLCEIFDGILPVKKQGVAHMWFAPWDVLIRWWGIEELYMDMMLDPKKVHAGISRMTNAHLSMLDQYESLGLLDTSNGNHRVGSGGLGITDELPGDDCNPAQVKPKHQWGSSTSQIFSEVSPDMHDEFALQYEKKLLERFGLTCYGCCEPLHNKIHLLRTVPNLRRISMSPWIDIEKGAAEIGQDYIYSYKPNPAVLATDRWNPDVAKKDIENVLEKTRGLRVELILKDISTVRNEPHRLSEWAKIAVETAEKYA